MYLSNNLFQPYIYLPLILSLYAYLTYFSIYLSYLSNLILYVYLIFYISIALVFESPSVSYFPGQPIPHSQLILYS